MSAYFLRRSAAALATVFGVLTLVFFLLRLPPGDVADLYDDPAVDAAARDAIRRAYGLDAPLPVQYALFLASAARLDFGASMSHHRPVSSVLADTLPATALLAASGLALEAALGTALALLLHKRRAAGRGRLLDAAVLAVHSVPAFWLGLVLLASLSYGLGLFPPSGTGPPGAAAVSLAERLRHLALPAVTLGIAGAPSVARHLAASMDAVVREEYVRAARAKGVSARGVLLRHALKPAFLPVVTEISLSLPTLVSGALVVEAVFAWPGMGRLSLAALHSRDYPLVVACTTVAALLVVAGSLLADCVHAAIDPRVRDALASGRRP